MSLMIALLLLHLAYRIEDQARLYQLERDGLTLSLLKKECLKVITDELSTKTFEGNEKLPDQTFTLHNGTPVTLKYKNGYETLAITYRFHYNEYLESGGITYSKKTHDYTMN